MKFLSNNLETSVASSSRWTSWPSLKTDVKNAGAEWVNQEVVVDGNLISSRKPDDIPAFNQEILHVLSQIRRPAARTA